MYSYRRKVIPVLVVLLFSASMASAALSIETFDGDLDINTISPESQAAQIVQVLDGQGEPVNESTLLNASGNEFEYQYDSNWSDMNHIVDGYYYALFETNSTVRNIQYRIIDQSPGGGETSEVEELSTGKLDVDIKNNFTGTFEAGSTVTVEAEVENNGFYYSVYGTDGELIITDNGGFLTYSATEDTLLAGSSPEDGAFLSSTNPWQTSEHVVAMTDSSPNDDWNPGSDLIVLDHYAGGTVSTGQDPAINTGSDDEVDTEGGKMLNEMSVITDSKYFVSSDAELDEGEPVVFDNDSDSIYTAQPDKLIAGNEPSEGTEVTFTNSIPERMGIASYDENTDGAGFDSTEDLVVFDRDDDGMFTDREDVVLFGSTPPEAADLNKSHMTSWTDEDYTTARAGDLEVFDADADGGSWNSSEDGIWIESGDSNGYQETQDTLVAGNPPAGVAPNQVEDLFDQWQNISGYDRNKGDTGFDPDADAVIRDLNGGGTYSENSDTIVAGSVASDSNFGGGTTLTSPDGFPEDWNLDVIESIDGGTWDSSQDTILRDWNDGGTYSPRADQVVNSGGSVDAASGTDLQPVNSVSSDLMWSDVDGDEMYDKGDEIFHDSDDDGLYTAQSDEQLAGLSLDVVEPGTPLQEANLWQETSDDSTPILFHDFYSGDGWDSSDDAIVHDLDEDGAYTGEADRIVEGDRSMAENGDLLTPANATNNSNPNVNAFITTGSNTSQVLQLARTEEGVYTGDIQIPEVHGTRMLVQVTAETPVSDLRGMSSETLRTRAKGIGFDLEYDSVNLGIQKKGEYSREIMVQNLLEDDTNLIDVNVSEELQNITSIDSSLDLPADGNSTLNMTFGVEDIEDAEGEITFTEVETGITEQVEVELNSPECQARTSTLCITSASRVDLVTDERGNFTRSLNMVNIGDKGSERNPEVAIEGNISEHVSIGNLTGFSDQSNLEVNFEADTPGNFSGEMLINSSGEIVIPLTLESNFIELEAEMNVTPDELEYGVIPEGDDTTPGDIRVENTGTVELQNVTITSSSYDVSQNTEEGVQTSSSRNYTVTLNSVESSQGQIEVTAYTEENEISETVDVSGSTVQPVSEMKNDLRTSVNDLRTQATSTEAMTQLTDIETQISSIQTSWDQGNYQQAQSKYQTAQSDLSSVQAQIQSNSDSDSTGSGTEGQDGTGSEEENSGGGGGIIILLFLLILILGAGFVLYTSYYPEEGDPLYDVLGERE